MITSISYVLNLTDNVLYILSYVLLQPCEKLMLFLFLEEETKYIKIIFIEFSTSVVI